MKVERYTIANTKPLINILYSSVHNISNSIYTHEQKSAWAPLAILDLDLKSNSTWYCVNNDNIAGYIDFIDETGYINHLYIHPDFQNKGYASLLYKTIEDYAIAQNISKLKVDASKVALSFFIRKGFVFEKENIVERNGIKLINFTLFKNIS